MASIPNHKADVVFVCEFQCFRDMLRLRDIHRVSNKITQSAWLGNGMEWVASAIGEERSHH